MRRGLRVLPVIAVLALAAGCGSAGGKGQNAAVDNKALNPEMGVSDKSAPGNADRRGERQTAGTSGRSGDVTLSGCLEKNLDTGQFVLVMQDKKQPGHDRLTLQEGRGVKLNGSVGKQVTLAGSIASGKADAFPRGYGNDTKPGGANDQRRMIVTALEKVGGACPISDR